MIRAYGCGQPGAWGVAWQSGPGACRDGRGVEARTTVPPFVTPCAVHSQYPSIGMLVGQVIPSAWQVFADAWPPVIAVAARKAQVRKVSLMLGSLS